MKMGERKKRSNEIVPVRGNIIEANYRIVGRSQVEGKKEKKVEKALSGIEGFANWMADRRGWDFSLGGIEVADEDRKKKKDLFDLDLGL